MRAWTFLLLALLHCGKRAVADDTAPNMPGHDAACESAPLRTVRSATMAYGRLYVLDEAGALVSFDPSGRSFRTHWPNSPHVRIATGGDGAVWAIDRYADSYRAYHFDKRGLTQTTVPIATEPDAFVPAPFGTGLAIMDHEKTRFVDADGSSRPLALAGDYAQTAALAGDPKNPKYLYAAERSGRVVRIEGSQASAVWGPTNETPAHLIEPLSSIAVRGDEVLVVGATAAHLLVLGDHAHEHRLALTGFTRTCGIDLIDTGKFWLVRSTEHYLAVAKP